MDNIHHNTRGVRLNPRWPRGYFDVLSAAGVPAKQHSFYAQWVRKFFSSELQGRRRRDLGLVDIERFLSKLGADEAVNEWQIEQARTALSLYYEEFRGIALDDSRATLNRFDAADSRAEGVVAERNLGDSAPVSDSSEPPGIPLPRRPKPIEQIPMPPKKPRAELVDWNALNAAVRETLRIKHYAYRTEKTYMHWIRRFVNYHNGRKPSTMGSPEIHQFLSHLAVNLDVAASTQNQALNAIVFLYRDVLKCDPGDFSDFQRARVRRKVPVVLSREEVAALLREPISAMCRNCSAIPTLRRLKSIRMSSTRGRSE